VIIIKRQGVNLIVPEETGEKGWTWEAFCCACPEEIDLDVTFLHEADGETYTCPACGAVQVARYVGEGFVVMKRKSDDESNLD